MLSCRELPDPGTEPMSPVAPAWEADSLPPSHQGSPDVLIHIHKHVKAQNDFGCNKLNVQKNPT